MNEQHVRTCIQVALRREVLDHIQLEEKVRKIGYLTTPFDEEQFWQITRQMRDEGLISITDEDDGFLYYRWEDEV